MHWLTQEVKLLLTAGFSGSVVRSLLNPEKGWQRWIVQVLIGAFAAVFLGGLASHVILKIMGEDARTSVYLAVGFVIGTAAEKAIEKFQNKMLS